MHTISFFLEVDTPNTSQSHHLMQNTFTPSPRHLPNELVYLDRFVVGFLIRIFRYTTLSLNHRHDFVISFVFFLSFAFASPSEHHPVCLSVCFMVLLVLLGAIGSHYDSHRVMMRHSLNVKTGTFAYHANALVWLSLCYLRLSSSPIAADFERRQQRQH